MSPTFAQLGIPFPLFEATVDQAANYLGARTCSFCHLQQPYCFRLGIGCDPIVACPACGVPNGLDADDRRAGPCRGCNGTVPFPDLPAGDICICYPCLRAGRAAITQDTELGMISWEQAVEGVTHGLPGLDHPDFELVPKEDDWVGARLPQDVMFELLRTPTYIAWQGERWLFCCRRPMVYLGDWSEEDFTRHAPDGDGQALFERSVQDLQPDLWGGRWTDSIGVYMFRCGSRGRFAGHWDMD